MLKMSFILNTTPLNFSNWLERYTRMLSFREFPTEKGRYSLQRASAQGFYPNLDRVTISGHWVTKDKDDPDKEQAWLPNINVITFDFTPLSPDRTEITATCFDAPSILVYFSELQEEIARLWPEIGNSIQLIGDAHYLEIAQNMQASKPTAEGSGPEVIRGIFNGKASQLSKHFEEWNMRDGGKFLPIMLSSTSGEEDVSYSLAEFDMRDYQAEDGVIGTELHERRKVGSVKISDFDNQHSQVIFRCQTSEAVLYCRAFLRYVGIEDKEGSEPQAEPAITIPGLAGAASDIVRDAAINSTGVLKYADLSRYDDMPLSEVKKKAARFDEMRGPAEQPTGAALDNGPAEQPTGAALDNGPAEQPTGAALDNGPAKQEKKSKRGPHWRSKAEKIAAVNEWDALDKDLHPVTLEEWLDSKFGNENGVLNVKPSTFHGWRRLKNS